MLVLYRSDDLLLLFPAFRQINLKSKIILKQAILLKTTYGTKYMLRLDLTFSSESWYKYWWQLSWSAILYVSLFSVMSYACYHTNAFQYSFWWEQHHIGRIIFYIYSSINIHSFCCHCLDTILKLWQITSYKILQCWVLQRYHIRKEQVS